MSKPEVRELNWKSRELNQVTADMFCTYYPPAIDNPVLVKTLRAMGGGEIAAAHLYGSAASGDASKSSLTDVLVIVRNQVAFCDKAIIDGNLKLGTVRDSGFHGLWGEKKQNFYLTTDGKYKIWVSTLREMISHANGALPGIEGGKGKGYAAGRWQKTEFPSVIDDATEDERLEIDLAFNQARLAGVRLALGLAPRVFALDQFADLYANLSYLADKRVEKADKSSTLVKNNYDHYVEMLTPILSCFVAKGILIEHYIKHGDTVETIYEKKMSLAEKEVKKWLKEGASNAFRTNFFKNIWTMGPWNSIKYGLSKVFRVFGAKKGK